MTVIVKRPRVATREALEEKVNRVHLDASELADVDVLLAKSTWSDDDLDTACEYVKIIGRRCGE